MLDTKNTDDKLNFIIQDITPCEMKVYKSVNAALNLLDLPGEKVVR